METNPNITSSDATIKPRHVALSIGNLGGGGQERQLSYLAEGMSQRGVSVSVVVWRPCTRSIYKDRLKEKGIEVFEINASSQVSRLLAFRRLLRRIRPDIVQAYSIDLNFPTWMACIGTAMQPIGGLRSDYWWIWKTVSRWRACMSFYFPQTIVTNSYNSLCAAKSHHCLFSPRKMVFIANGVSIDTQYQSNDYPIESPSFEMVGVGRLQEVKNWSGLLDVLADFSQTARFDWRFQIFGTGPDEEKLRDQVNSLKLHKNVIFRGFTRDVRKVLRTAHVLLLSSNFEGTPNVILEAMANARPVIATDVGDVPNIVRHEKDGFIVSQNRLSDFKQYLTFLNTYRDKAREMGISARTRVQKNHSVNLLIDRTLALYDDLDHRNPVSADQRREGVGVT